MLLYALDKAKNVFTKGEPGMEGLKNAGKTAAGVGAVALCGVVGFKGFFDGFARGLEYLPPVYSQTTTIDTTGKSEVKEMDIYFTKMCDTVTKIGTAASLKTQGEFFGKDIPKDTDEFRTELDASYELCYGGADFKVTMDLTEDKAVTTVDIPSNKIWTDVSTEVMSRSITNEKGEVRRGMDLAKDAGGLAFDITNNTVGWLGDATGWGFLKDAASAGEKVSDLDKQIADAIRSFNENATEVLALNKGWEDCGSTVMEATRPYIGNTVKNTLRAGFEAASPIDERLGDTEIIVTIDGQSLEDFKGVPETSIKKAHDELMKRFKESPNSTYVINANNKATCEVPSDIKKIINPPSTVPAEGGDSNQGPSLAPVGDRYE